MPKQPEERPTPKKILGMDQANWRELLMVAGLALAVAFVMFFWDISKNGSDLLTYANKALTQKDYVAVTVDPTRLVARGVASDGTYTIEASLTPGSDPVTSIQQAAGGSGLGEFRFLGSAGGTPIGNAEASAVSVPAASPIDPAKPLTFFGRATAPENTLAIVPQGTKTVGSGSYSRFEVVSGKPTANVIARALETYGKGFRRNLPRAYIYTNSRSKLPGYMLETGSSGLALTVWRFNQEKTTVAGVWEKFKSADAAGKLAILGLNPAEVAQILSER
ncbi:MAG TPA: hypothetical protein VGL40_03885 [Bacillota bacterium]|jgi:hypothetical protein